MPDDLIARAEAVMEGVSPEPWHIPRSGQGIDSGKYGTVIERGNVKCMSYCYGGTSTIEGDNLDADLRFIAAARTLVPELVDALKTARAEEQQWCDVAQKAFGVGTPSMLESALKAAQAEVERLRVALRRSECRHLGGIESWDSLPPTLICCDCGADVSPEPRP